MFSAVCVLFALIATGLAATITPVLVTPGCVHNGKTYQIGESFQPSPCEHCFCDRDGRAPCAIADCFFTPCVDAIHDPTKCCPVCPNGENCRHQDGTIIKKGDVYRPDANTVCSCANSLHFGQSKAICAVKAVDPVHTIVDPVHVG